MASGGHNRKSAKQAELDGTRRADRHIDPVDIAPGEVLPPDGLTADALVAWKRYIQPRINVGFYTEPAEAPLLGMWCIMLVSVYSADAITPLGGVYETEDQYGTVDFKVHPGHKVTISSISSFASLSSKLGLDPLSRMALADLAKPLGKPDLPAGAPPAFKPKVVRGKG